MSVFLAVAAATAAQQADASISYTTDGAVYTQNFNSLPNTPLDTSLGNSPIGWIDDTTTPGAGQFSIPGFYLWHPNSAAEGGTNGHQRLRPSAGNSFNGAFMSYGSTGDRALGMLSSATMASPNVDSYFGARFTNNTGHRLDQLTLSYTGEQWRDGGTLSPLSVSVAQTTSFDIKIGSGFPTDVIQDAGFGHVAALDFTSPVFGAVTGIALNGNSAANRQQFGPVTVNGIYWGPGEDLWIRWRDPNNSGNDHGLAIDDLSFSATVSVPPTYAYTSIDYPGGTSAFANGVSPSGDVVGEYDSSGTTRAFIRTAAGAYSTFDHPSAIGYTSANGLNNSGQVVGTYSPDNLNTARAYRRTGNTYMDLVPLPGAPLTFGTYINEAGHAIGFSEDAGGTRRGFIFDGTGYTTLAAPGAADTEVFGINNAGVVVGDYIVGGVIHGFSYNNGAYTTIDFPGARGTVAQGINDAGQIAGLYTDTHGFDHGFLLDNGVYTALDYPSASLTWGFAINNAGQIAGYYEDLVGAGHGFLATPMQAADFNRDGDVDADDLAAWSANFGLTTGVDKTKGDANLDGVVDGADLVMWQRQFKPAPATAQASIGVPEPGSLALIGMGLFALRAAVGRGRRSL